MHETTADVRRDIEETRARVSDTLGQLEAEIGNRRSAITERVVAVRDRVASTGSVAQDGVITFAREHPWYAIAGAIGIGLFLGRSGADAAAAHAVADGTKRAAGSIADGTKRAAGSIADATTDAARAGAEKVKGLVHRGDDADPPASGAGLAVEHDPATGAIGSSAEDVGQRDAAQRQANDSGMMYRLRTGLVEVLGVNELLDQMRAEADRIGR